MRRIRRPRPDMLTLGEAARLMRCSREWLLHLAWREEIAAEWDGRQYWLTLEALEDYKARRRRRGRPPKVTNFE